MPLKQKSGRTHHVAHRKEKRTKRFLKVYAPFIPLLLIIGCGLFIGRSTEYSTGVGKVQSYAHDINSYDLLEETNKMRQSDGLKPLKSNSFLTKAAQNKAYDMGTKDYWSHITPDGRKPWEFINTSEYQYRKAAENLAYGFDTSKTTVSGWMNSSGHRANVMDPELSEVGFGMVNVPNYQNNGPETIVVALYADPADNSVTTTSNQIASLASPSPSKDISYVESISSDKMPWSGFTVGLIAGCIVMYILIKHARQLRLALRRSERFVIHHPILDITLIALVALAAFASQTIGTIH